MPSFLSKVFARKKGADSPSSAKSPGAHAPSPLDGKFEAISPTVSPSAAHFSQYAQQKSQRERNERDGGLAGLLRSKSRGGDASLSPKAGPAAPHLSLNLSELREARKGLGGVFGSGADVEELMSEDEIGARLLNTEQTLALVRACSKYIDERGLETLGIMHPHWYSASPDVQRKLVTLFLRSLSAPDPTISNSRFESEVNYTHDPHDVASVLRWAVRHFRPEDSTRLGGTNAWYDSFTDAERSAEYPTDAFSKSLTLPTPHRDLLLALLDVTFSLAAHAEANGISGSKFSKLIGLWLLEEKEGHETLDWQEFYSAWDKAGRMLEHLFLARVRDESSKLPQRLTSLVQGYPYGESEGGLLARPRYCTRRYPSLLIQIDTELPARNGKLRTLPRRYPLGIISDALRATPVETTDELSEAWESVKKAAEEEGSTNITRIFVTETLNLLALVPAPSSEAHFAQLILTPLHKRSSSADDTDTIKGPSVQLPPAPAAIAPSHSQMTTSSSATVGNWSDFQNAGFSETPGVAPLAETLMDRDVERSSPPSQRPGILSRASSKRNRVKLSVDIPPSAHNGQPTSTSAAATETAISPSQHPARTARIARVELDEAFVDFWADAVADPDVTAHWPQFVVCQLRTPVSAGGTPDEPKITWVVIERTFSTPPPAPTPAAQTPARSATPEESASGGSETDAKGKRATSPRPSIDSHRKSSALSATKKRFGIFTRSLSIDKDKGKSAKGLKSPKLPTGRVGEMGEVLPEEEESNVKTPKGLEEKKEEGKGLGIVEAVAGASVAAVVAGVGATLLAEAPVLGAEDAPKPVVETKEDSPLAAEALKTEEPPKAADKVEPTTAAVEEEAPTASSTEEHQADIATTEASKQETLPTEQDLAPPQDAVVDESAVEEASVLLSGTAKVPDEPVSPPEAGSEIMAESTPTVPSGVDEADPPTEAAPIASLAVAEDTEAALSSNLAPISVPDLATSAHEEIATAEAVPEARGADAIVADEIIQPTLVEPEVTASPELATSTYEEPADVVEETLHAPSADSTDEQSPSIVPLAAVSENIPLAQVEKAAVEEVEPTREDNVIPDPVTFGSTTTAEDTTASPKPEPLSGEGDAPTVETVHEVSAEERVKEANLPEAPVVVESATEEPSVARPVVDEAAPDLTPEEVTPVALSGDSVTTQEQVPEAAAALGSHDELTANEKELSDEKPVVEDLAIAAEAAPVETLEVNASAEPLVHEELVTEPPVVPELDAGPLATRGAQPTEPSAEALSSEKPAVETDAVDTSELATEERSVEQPAVEQPTGREPTVDGPIVQELTSVAPTTEQSVVDKHVAEVPEAKEQIGSDLDARAAADELSAPDVTVVAPASPAPVSETVSVDESMTEPASATDIPEAPLVENATEEPKPEVTSDKPVIADVAVEVPAVVHEPEAEYPAIAESATTEPSGDISLHDESNQEAPAASEPTEEQPVVELIAEEEPAVSILAHEGSAENAATIEEPPSADHTHAPGEPNLTNEAQPEARAPSPDQPTIEQPVVELIAEEEPAVSILAGDVPAEGTAVVEEAPVDLEVPSSSTDIPAAGDIPETPASHELEPIASEPIASEPAMEEEHVEPPAPVSETLEDPSITEDVTEEPSQPELEVQEPAAAEVTLEKPAEAEASPHSLDEPAVEQPIADEPTKDVPFIAAADNGSASNLGSALSEANTAEAAQEPSTEPEEDTPQQDKPVQQAEDLPPAPEPVVLSGATPGPQVALSTSEPAALHQAADNIVTPAPGEGLTDAEETAASAEHVVHKLVPSAEEELPVEPSTAHITPLAPHPLADETSASDVIPDAVEHSAEDPVGDASVAAFASSVSDPVIAHPSREVSLEEEETS